MLSGHGNNGRDGFEGVRKARMIGTYMHGPLLPKNAWLADRLIELALARRLGEEPELEPLDDALEAAAHESARARPRCAAEVLKQRRHALTAQPSRSAMIPPTPPR